MGKNRKNAVIYDTDLWGEVVKLYDHTDQPDCEMCGFRGRGANVTGKGPRKAKLITSVDYAIYNQARHRWGHIGKVTVDDKILKRLGPRHPGLKSNQAWACQCCLDTAWNTARVQKSQLKKQVILA